MICVIHQKTHRVPVWMCHWTFHIKDSNVNFLMSDARYRERIQDFLGSQIQQHNLQNKWFHEDGIICNTARNTMNFL